MEILRLDSRSKNFHQRLDGIVDCYREVFAGEPWNEWYKCPSCGNRYGKKDEPELTKNNFECSCGEILVEYWPSSDVLAEILLDQSKDGSSFWIAVVEDRVIAFCWGYPITWEGLIEKMELPINANHLLKKKVSEIEASRLVVALQDEVGVHPDYRNQGIAKCLVSNRNKDFLDQGLVYGVVRTRLFPEPSVTYKWYSRIGYKILAAYTGDDGRVIMGRELLTKL